ncbi:hypothetical protein [Escherichia fergusonii]|uniref:hypothetical protein n=1 Tax=Escherichia fergusonii TaxID=564 RepID=UPI002433FEC9|nr:hypothetical protein [Escherichia fergusonii]WGA68610.1 hypothetical protein NFL02_22685 [Escherichia fergusonii]
MNKSILILGVTLLASSLTPSAMAKNETKLWVAVDRTERHTCPSSKCGVAGKLFFREGVDYLEKKGEWVRITEPYSASCVGGESEYIKEGNKSCTRKNGIVNGKFAEWVKLSDLSSERPSDPAEGASGDDALVQGSDDYRIYRKEFTSAARKLINEGMCAESDFKEIGGWMASSNKGENIYFTYCGGMKNSNKIYLDVKSGKTFR